MNRAALAFLLLVGGVATAGEPAPPEVVQLPKFEVREKSVTDFGMSVRTNFGVLFGRRIAWMRVGDVVPRSSAAFGGLAPDDEILSIDDKPLAEFTKETMLRTFFERKHGDRVKLVVREARTRRFRIVELTAGAIRPLQSNPRG